MFRQARIAFNENAGAAGGKDLQKDYNRRSIHGLDQVLFVYVLCFYWFVCWCVYVWATLCIHRLLALSVKTTKLRAISESVVVKDEDYQAELDKAKEEMDKECFIFVF